MAKKNVKKLVYISSGGTVYGNPSSLPVNELAVLNPVSIYGATKVAVENYLTILCAQLDIDLTIVRPSNPFGPRQYCKGAQGLIATLLDKAIKKQPIILFDQGKAIRDYIYIGDLVQAIYQIIKQGAVGIYNISYNSGYSVENITSLAEQVTGHCFDRNLKPKREFDIDEIVLDSSKAQKELDWKPMVAIEEGINRQFNWMVNI
jgi:UDP-glucose 4-epimerase